jgi:ABC-type branched-subunit amino acid transport system ATPase component
MGICAVPEGRGIFSELTVLDNLKLGKITRRDARAILRKAKDGDLEWQSKPTLM